MRIRKRNSSFALAFTSLDLCLLDGRHLCLFGFILGDPILVRLHQPFAGVVQMGEFRFVLDLHFKIRKEFPFRKPDQFSEFFSCTNWHCLFLLSLKDSVYCIYTYMRIYQFPQKLSVILTGIAFRIAALTAIFCVISSCGMVSHP